MPLPLLVQDLLMLAVPQGGQRTARRNAWAGMAQDAARSRARREAEDALLRSEDRSRHRQGTGS